MSEQIQTVGELKRWLEAFSDEDVILGAFQGQPLVSLIICRHAEGRVIIEVPRLEHRQS